MTGPRSLTVRQIDFLLSQAMTSTLSSIDRLAARWRTGSSTRCSSASAAGGSRRPRPTTSPAPPACPGRRCTGSSRAARTWRFDALLRHETARFFDVVTGPLEAVDTLEDPIVIGFAEAARFVRRPRAAPVPAHPRARAGAAGPHAPAASAACYAIATRVHRPAPPAATSPTTPPRRPAPTGSSASSSPTPSSPRRSLDLTDEAAVRPFVRTYVLPALAATPRPQEP